MAAANQNVQAYRLIQQQAAQLAAIRQAKALRAERKLARATAEQQRLQQNQSSALTQAKGLQKDYLQGPNPEDVVGPPEPGSDLTGPTPAEPSELDLGDLTTQLAQGQVPKGLVRRPVTPKAPKLGAPNEITLIDQQTGQEFSALRQIGPDGTPRYLFPNGSGIPPQQIWDPVTAPSGRFKIKPKGKAEAPTLTDIVGGGAPAPVAPTAPAAPPQPQGQPQAQAQWKTVNGQLVRVR